MNNDLLAAVETAPKQVLASVVKLVQKEGMRGCKGGWKEFLNVYDTKFGNSISDPAKRPHETLISFLKTFTDEKHLKFIASMLQWHSNVEVLEQIKKVSACNESPEQRLVCSTLDHPQYSLKYAFPSCNEGWVVTKVKKRPKSSSSDTLLALDCEMVLCEDGTNAVVKVCVVDRSLQVKLDKLVNPGKRVVDYKTDITGITEEDLIGVSCSLQDIQKSMKKMLKKGVILVGHSLYNDLDALKLDHKKVIDTSFIFRTPTNRAPSLKNVCKSVLGYQLREDGQPHNCLDDACAAMKLVLAKVDRGVDNDFPLIEEDVKDVAETAKAKLLLHGIPINVPDKALLRIFSQEFRIELKHSRNKNSYSALAIFKNPEEAQQAFDSVSGIFMKDKYDLPQKLIDFQLTSGVTVKLYVRKNDNGTEAPAKKRVSSQIEEDTHEAKKVKKDESCDQPEVNESNQCVDHLKEIEQLKKEISRKDLQISAQDKIITTLKSKLESAKKKGHW